VIVVRADWLYSLELVAHDLGLNIELSPLTYSLDPLTRDEAIESATNPLNMAGISFEDAVIKDIVDKLLEFGDTASLGVQYIQPVQLQLILDTLCSTGEQNGALDRAFTWDAYTRAGGVDGILRDYLTRSLRNRSEAWHLLSALY